MIFILKSIGLTLYIISTIWAFVVPGALAVMTGENVWLWLYALNFSGFAAIVVGSWAEDAEKNLRVVEP